MDTSVCIFSLELEVGPTPSDSLVGEMTSQSGPEAAPASPSAPQESRWVRLIRAIYSRRSAALSRAADLQLSLASKLHQDLDVNGSPEYDLKWRTWDMPSGPPICALRASGRRTSDKGCTGWPTPMVNDELGSGYCYGPKQPDGSRAKFLKLPGAAALSGWPTPRAEDSESTGAHRGTPDTLTSATRLAGWMTPTTEDAGRNGSLEDYRKYVEDGQTSGCRLRAQVHPTLAGWGTPSVQDSRHATLSLSQTRRDPNVLSNQVYMAGWATPTTRDHKDGTGGGLA